MTIEKRAEELYPSITVSALPAMICQYNLNEINKINKINRDVYITAATEWKEEADKKDVELITLKSSIEEKDKIISDLKTVMIAAAEEIQEHWQAHCEKGEGPTSLMRRLEEGIPAQYGYTAGRFAEMKKKIEEKDRRIAELVEGLDMDFGGFILGEIWHKRLISKPDCWYYNNKKVSIVDLYKKFKQSLINKNKQP